MSSSVSSSSASLVLLVGRDLILDLLKTSDPDVNAIDAIIMAAAIQANIGPATTGPDRQLAYGGLHEIPPDDVRRPISINRLAQIVEMPFETVRRRVRDLVRRGRLQDGHDGVFAPNTHFQRDTRMRAVVEIDALCARGYARLERGGFFTAAALPAFGAAPDEPPVRAVARLVTEFGLRAAPALVATVGDYASALILLEMNQINTGPLGDDPARADELADPSYPFDERARPARAAQIASGLGFAYETTRRRLEGLQAQGLCTRVQGGYILPRRKVVPLALGYAPANEMNLHRLYRGCAEVGAVASWRSTGQI